MQRPAIDDDGAAGERRAGARSDLPAQALPIDQLRFGIAIMGADARMLAVNPALTELTGYTQEQLLSDMDLRILTHPDDMAAEIDLAEQMWRQELDHFVVEKRLVRPDGSVCWARQEMTVLADPDGTVRYLIQLQDISPSKQAEHDLRDSRTRYMELVERMPIGILSSDAEGRIVTANTAAAAIAGLGSIPVGFRMETIIHPDDLPELATVIAEHVGAGLDFHVEFRIVRPDGTHRWVRNDAHPNIAADGRFEGLTGTWLDVSSIRAADVVLRQQAEEDQLTGLGNRRYLFDALDAAVKAGETGGAWPSVLFVDLDGFKAVNDANGHGIGDLVLIEVADRLGDALGPDDVAARIGGDEFVVCIAGAPNAGGTRAETVAEALIDSLSDPYVIDGRVLEIGASIGIADWRPGLAPDDLVRDADRAVYQAKRDGRGCWRRS
ncbi:MAG: diguanylate cyclase [Actinobacteria bacterium]|nr:diguanylate cyclase [Actinomycetota bacterium]